MHFKIKIYGTNRGITGSNPQY